MSDLAVAHSSDLHIDASRITERFHPLCRVIDTALAEQADVLILAGDVFDHNRLPLALLDQTARILADAALPIVILPGNHDCVAGGESVYLRGGLADPDNVHVIGVSGDSLLLSEFDVEIWGRAHADYANMSPLGEPLARTTARQIAVAHGHWFRGDADRHRAWLITDEEIAATQADYVALGHWPQATPAGDGSVPAYYSGSPDLAATINVVRWVNGGGPVVRRAPLRERTAS
jgi:DNA repair exonuclease SbcCD nuclease subunit